MHAERVIASELKAMGYHVNSVRVATGRREELRTWPAIVVDCQGLPLQYDCLDSDLLGDDVVLRAWVDTQWGKKSD